MAGVVGPGHPAGERPSRLSGIALDGQGQVAAGIEPVSEPVQQSPDTGIRSRIRDVTIPTEAIDSILDEKLNKMMQAVVDLTDKNRRMTDDIAELKMN